MAIPVREIFIGIDVGKAFLTVCDDGREVVTIDNTAASIKRWLSTLSGKANIALEATGIYHLELALQAYDRGHAVFLINGYQLNHYRNGVGVRAKTDLTDARLIYRYLCHEVPVLTPWEPPSAGYQRIVGLLRRRATLVQSRVKITQSFKDLPEMAQAMESLSIAFKEADNALQKALRDSVSEAGWEEDVRRCQAIEGIGPQTSIALVTLFHRGTFRRSDSYIAFLGLDVRVRESGKSAKRRRLSKQGNPEVRRLLYLAAMQAKRQPAWSDFYQKHIDRGLAPKQVLNMLARKLARVAFALLRNQTQYTPKEACSET